MKTHREVLETWFDRVWTRQDTRAIYEMLAPDICAKGLGADAMRSPEEFAAFHGALCGLLTEFRFTLDRVVEADDWAWAHCIVKAKTKSSGRPVEFCGVLICRIQNGKLVEGSNHFDFLGLFSQMGLLPADTFQRCLVGTKVA